MQALDEVEQHQANADLARATGKVEAETAAADAALAQQRMAALQEDLANLQASHLKVSRIRPRDVPQRC